MSKVERHKTPQKSGEQLRRGWTTGACATAAAKSALNALLTGEFIDPVEIALPKGDTPAFALATEHLDGDHASAGIVKDAGDDPDVTHGATIIATVRRGPKGSGIRFSAGEGVGTVTKAGLPLAIGEPAINPVPRQLMTQEVENLCRKYGVPADFLIEISVPGGEKIAERTWNGRLGIVGGISILGTTGVVHPFSCSAWIHSIHRGIDVARANDLQHVLGATGSTSETAAMKLHDFREIARLDMGDFVGGLLKYLRKNPIERITLAGGFAKFSKLAQGAMDLHSGRSQVDLDWLANLALQLGVTDAQAQQIRKSNTAMEAAIIANDAGIDLAGKIADLAQKEALKMLRDAPVCVEVMIFDRQGNLSARTGWGQNAD